jgi:hypothetical protein
MKLIVFLCIILAILLVFKKSQKFSRYLKCFENSLPLLSDKRVYDQMLAYFGQLVGEIAVYLIIASLCVFVLAWVI